MDLEQRVGRLEDRFALDDLNTRYFLAADSDDLGGVGDSFAEDAIFATSGHVGATGRQGIVDYIAGARGHMGLTIHTPHYGLYTFLGDDRAAGIIGAHLEMVLAGQSIYGAVRYADEYRKSDGCWRIWKRDMRTIFIGDWSRSAEVFASSMPVQWPGIDPLPSDYPRKG